MSFAESDDKVNIDKSSDFLGAYLHQLTKYPVLSKDKELYLGRLISKYRSQIKIIKEEYARGEISLEEYESSLRIKQNRLRQSKQELINSNLRLVVYIAKRYHKQGIELLEMINEGNIGLIEAVERFDFRRGCKFSTYGVAWIQQTIVSAIYENDRNIRLPSHIINAVKQVAELRQHLAQEAGREVSNGEIASYWRVAPQKIAAIVKSENDSSSLNVVIDHNNMTTMIDMIANDYGSDPYNSSLDRSKTAMLAKVLQKMSRRERYIICHRYGLFGKERKTLKEIGEKLAITRERVRQIQHSCISQLRKNGSIRDFFL